jgi:putative hydrolase of the HAD superfamily
MINLNGIKNIIFDFGGVILNINHSLPEKKFRKLGIDNFNLMYSQSVQNDLFDKLEKGFIKPEVFRNELRKYINAKVSDKEIDDAWNAILLNIPAERIKALERVKQQYQTFLLSNTNKIHYDQYLSELKRVYGFNSFNDLFIKAYFSFEIGLRKPDKEIFEFVLNENILIPEETLFIDDSIQHIKGAAKAGIRTFYLEKDQDISEIFAY